MIISFFFYFYQKISISLSMHLSSLIRNDFDQVLGLKMTMSIVLNVHSSEEDIEQKHAHSFHLCLLFLCCVISLYRQRERKKEKEKKKSRARYENMHSCTSLIHTDEFIHLCSLLLTLLPRSRFVEHSNNMLMTFKK